MMLFTKNSGSGFNSAAKILFGPYDNALSAEQAELAVPVETAIPPSVPIQLIPPFNNTRAYAILRNTSSTAQNIRYGVGLPSFTPTVSGQLLKPGEQVTLTDIRITVLGIADVIGALCSRFIVRSSGI